MAFEFLKNIIGSARDVSAEDIEGRLKAERFNANEEELAERYWEDFLDADLRKAEADKIRTRLSQKLSSPDQKLVFSLDAGPKVVAVYRQIAREMGYELSPVRYVSAGTDGTPAIYECDFTKTEAEGVTAAEETPVAQEEEESLATSVNKIEDESSAVIAPAPERQLTAESVADNLIATLREATLATGVELPSFATELLTRGVERLAAVHPEGLAFVDEAREDYARSVEILNKTQAQWGDVEEMVDREHPEMERAAELLTVAKKGPVRTFFSRLFTGGGVRRSLVEAGASRQARKILQSVYGIEAKTSKEVREHLDQIETTFSRAALPKDANFTAQRRLANLENSLREEGATLNNVVEGVRSEAVKKLTGLMESPRLTDLQQAQKHFETLVKNPGGIDYFTTLDNKKTRLEIAYLSAATVNTEMDEAIEALDLSAFASQQDKFTALTRAVEPFLNAGRIGSKNELESKKFVLKILTLKMKDPDTDPEKRMYLKHLIMRANA